MARRARSEDDWAIASAIGARLRQARIKARITQVTMAELMGVTQPTISNWERGVNLIDVPNLEEWARHTKRTVAWFLDARSRCLYGLSGPPKLQQSFPEHPALAIAEAS